MHKLRNFSSQFAKINSREIFETAQFAKINSREKKKFLSIRENKFPRNVKNFANGPIRKNFFPRKFLTLKYTF